MDHQVIQVPQVPGDLQEHLVTRALVARLELLEPQVGQEMGLQDYLEHEDLLDTPDIRVLPVIEVGNFNHVGLYCVTRC